MKKLALPASQQSIYCSLVAFNAAKRDGWLRPCFARSLNVAASLAFLIVLCLCCLSFALSLNDNLFNEKRLELLRIVDCPQDRGALSENQVDVLKTSAHGLLQLSAYTRSSLGTGTITYLWVEEVDQRGNAEANACEHDVIPVPDAFDCHWSDHSNHKIPVRYQPGVLSVQA